MQTGSDNELEERRAEAWWARQGGTGSPGTMMVREDLRMLSLAPELLATQVGAGPTEGTDRGWDSLWPAVKHSG